MRIVLTIVALSFLTACAAPYKTVETCGGDYKLKASRRGPLTGSEGRP